MISQKKISLPFSGHIWLRNKKELRCRTEKLIEKNKPLLEKYGKYTATFFYKENNKTSGLN
jgi:hypothetical protein